MLVAESGSGFVVVEIKIAWAWAWAWVATTSRRSTCKCTASWQLIADTQPTCAMTLTSGTCCVRALVCTCNYAILVHLSFLSDLPRFTSLILLELQHVSPCINSHKNHVLHLYIPIKYTYIASCLYRAHLSLKTQSTFIPQNCDYDPRQTWPKHMVWLLHFPQWPYWAWRLQSICERQASPRSLPANSQGKYVNLESSTQRTRASS